MHDKGNIPYTQDVSLEEVCYNELEACDIVVCIIGSKFGTKSGSGDYSITMSELKKAIKSRKRFIFTFKRMSMVRILHIWRIKKRILCHIMQII